MTDTLPETIDGLPNLCGDEEQIAAVMSRAAAPVGPRGAIDFSRVRSAASIALHMHQPLIPAGSGDLHSAEIISNLRYMFEHPEVADAHNAAVFKWCYQRMGEFVPTLVGEGKQPRVMLDYSGCLLHGLVQMGAHDVIEQLKPLAQDSRYTSSVEWLGTAWGHAVAPSTPSQDFRLHVRAWQHHFAALFGMDALSRVRGFSPPEMALPNHPDVCYDFVKTLVDCGYRWVLVQEHSIERIEDGTPIRARHLPHRLIARNARGETASILAIIKTQGSDTKLVAQMQPYYEARGLSRVQLAGKSIPQLVTQIGDGENGGVMMNEFPSKYLEVMRDVSAADVAPANASEYLDYLATLGMRDEDFPAIRPINQHKIWSRFQPGDGSEALGRVIAELRKEDNRFHVEGASWTNDISWVRGYEGVLGPMQSASAAFAEKMLKPAVPTTDPRYRRALYHLLLSQTSCFRYWGQGQWTDYGKELCRRAIKAIG